MQLSIFRFRSTIPIRFRRSTTSHGKYRRSLCCAIWVVAAQVVGMTQVAARSTLIARFADKAIAGPGLEQQSVLYLHYFPGDGEAVVRTVLQGSGSMRLIGAEATLGQVQAGSSSIEIDYVAHPLATASVDTLYIDLVAEEMAALSWSVAVYSSLDPEGAPAHQLEIDLAVSAPPPVSWSIAPEQVYQGERFELRAIVRYDATDGPGVEEINWAWPRELVWQEGDAPRVWDGGLVPGQVDTLSWSVRAVSVRPGPVVLAATAQSIDQSPVPLVAQYLQIDPLPTVVLEAEIMEVGKRGQISCIWRNESTDSIRLEALRLEVNATFADVALVAAPAQAVFAQGENGRSIVVDGLESLGVGEEVRVVLEAVPQRPGPFIWPSACKPVGRDKFIALRGANTVNAIWSGIAEVQGDEGQLLTDLQLVNQAFAQALARQVDELPLVPGARLFLQAEDEKNVANWIVEDALTDALQERGYRVLVRQPEVAEVDVIYYRLVRARVVYSSAQRGFFPWGKDQRREAYGDLFLRLETAADAIIRWDRRVQAYDWDLVPKGGIEVLGGGDMVEQMVNKSENKAIERSLSAGIIGGLFYIFFVL